LYAVPGADDPVIYRINLRDPTYVATNVRGPQVDPIDHRIIGPWNGVQSIRQGLGHVARLAAIEKNKLPDQLDRRSGRQPC